MANSNKKHTLKDYIRVYKKRFSKLDKKTKIQLIAIGVLVVLIIVAAMAALSGRGENPVSSSEKNNNSLVFSGSYNPLADAKYEDEYLKLIKEYDDVVIPENQTEDRNYFRETLFVGDSNTEGLAVYNHLSLQYVLGVTGMAIQRVTTNECMWFVGYDKPVTIPTAVGMLKPRRIIINFGTNNAGGTSTEDFIFYYEKALDAIEKAYPYADIIVSSILPVAKERDYPSITMQDIDEFNLALAEMCRERELKFLNTAELYKDSETGFMKPEYVAKDGIHLSSEGYKAFLEYVGSHKHVEADNRPARGSIPTRRNAPYVPTESSSLAASSVVSSSKPYSSSIYSSSIFSSSIVSSSVVQSSSVASSSSVGQSSSMVPSSSVGQSSSNTDSSENISSSELPTPSAPAENSPAPEESTAPVLVCTYCGDNHADAEHKCTTCGKTGHGNTCPVVCGICGLEHKDADHPCSVCGQPGHGNDHPITCGICGLGHKDADHPCAVCGQPGHGNDHVYVCSYCGSNHEDSLHQCTTCGNTGHGNTCPT